MFSSKARYALKAALVLAREGRWVDDDGKGLLSIKDLAKLGGLPRPFLAKIMQELSAVGIVRARKGPGGGVALARKPDQFSIADVIFAVDLVEGFRRCILEDRPCREVEACPLHTTCKTIREDILAETTLQDLLDQSPDLLATSSNGTA